jgi:uroporphyrinogen-III synthase
VRVAALGFDPVLTPFLTIEPLDPRMPNPAAIAAALVTSGNALPACQVLYRDTKLLTVGDATADKARHMGFTQVLSAGADATALAELVRRTRRPEDGTLLLAAGQGHAGALEAALRRDGFRVVRRVAYRSRPVRVLAPEAEQALRAGRVRAALFFSAETARSFVRAVQAAAGLADAMRGSEAMAIGAPAGVALQALPWRRVSVAAQPTQDALLALLA